MANLQLESVSKIYPSGALALYKANLDLSDSEFIAIVGGEKSGKTTFLRLVAGLDNVTEGQILVGGKDMTKAEPGERDIAMIFQGNTLYQSMNVFDNMAYGLRMRKASQAVIDQRVRAASDMLGLNDVLFRKPKALTAEQKQIATFARAIVREPKVYLLDDPLAGFDADTRARLRSLLINLQMRMSGTFVYATKNVNEALTMATRLIVLRDGFVQQIDTPANLYEYPANAYVAFLIGSPTVNLINNAHILRDECGVYVQSGDVKLPLPENIVARFTDIESYANTDKKVILGIRPEDIRTGKEGELKAKVTTAEKVCGKGFADCEIGGLSFVATSDAEKDSEVYLQPDLTHAFLFDGETRLTLLSRDSGYTDTGRSDASFTPLPYAEEEQIKNSFLHKPSSKKKK